MKVAYILTDPEKCYYCKFKAVDNSFYPICWITKRATDMDDKPDWCPLKPLPEKLDGNDWHRMFNGEFKIREAKGYGWNACLDEITGNYSKLLETKKGGEK